MPPLQNTSVPSRLFMTTQIQAIKADLEDKNAPFGVDLLIPQVGGNARKTNVFNFIERLGDFLSHTANFFSPTTQEASFLN